MKAIVWIGLVEEEGLREVRKRSGYHDEPLKDLRKKYGRVTFGHFLMAWREAEEMTQAEFSRKLKLSSANLCDLEQGRRVPLPASLGCPKRGLSRWRLRG